MWFTDGQLMEFRGFLMERATRYLPVLGICALLFRNYVSTTSAIESSRQYMSDECDWFGSGADVLTVGIQPVYLRCQEGVIAWQYPKNAMRIILRLGHSNKRFKGCLKVIPFSSGVTLYLEEPKRLRYLYGRAEETKDITLPACFRSAGGHVALFLEAHRSSEKASFQFMYSLQPIHKKKSSDCQPCSDQEILFLYCSSDFVARGHISSLYQNEDIQQTELTVRSHNVIKDSQTKVFQQVANEDKNGTYFKGVVHRPLHCGTKVGRGEFLFIGRWQLGMPTLSCAPRWREWKKIRQKAVDSNDMQCIIE